MHLSGQHLLKGRQGPESAGQRVETGSPAPHSDFVGISVATSFGANHRDNCPV